jgi:hypothetical protein
MKPAEFRRMMSRLAHPQGAQRYEVEFGKPLVPDLNLPDIQPEPSPVVIQPAMLSDRDLRVKDLAKKSHTVAWGGSLVEYSLSLVVSTDIDAGATVTQDLSGIRFPAGTVLTLTAVPSGPLYIFESWVAVPGGASTDNPLLLTMNSDIAITAFFDNAP